MRPWLLSVALLATAGVASAQDDDFHITPAEKAACSTDAARFCSDTYPDEHQLLLCMKMNRPYLSAGCRRIFDIGLKRRGL